MSAASSHLATISYKVLMALSGLFLCIFLIGHLSGNLQLIFVGGEVGKLQFNAYAHFMTTNPLIKAISYINYTTILGHAIIAIILSLYNKSARPVSYSYEQPGKTSIWSSRNMGILGTMLLAFIVVHMGQFWFQMHFGAIGVDAAGNKDLYTVVYTSFKQPWYVILYVLAMLPVAFHLAHGFQSAFRSLGIYHSKYTPIIQTIGYGFAIIVPLAFAVIPVYIYFN